jgi:hypothetical protein
MRFAKAILLYCTLPAIGVFGSRDKAEQRRRLWRETKQAAGAADSGGCCDCFCGAGGERANPTYLNRHLTPGSGRFKPSGAPEGKSFDEMMRNFELRRDKEFISHVCADHAADKSPG